MFNAITTIADFFWDVISLLNQRLTFDTGLGFDLSWLQILFACIVISAVVSLFFRGAQG